MRFNRFLTKSLVVFASVVTLALVLLPVVSFAVSSTDTFGLNPISSEVTLGNSDLRVTVARFIRTGLSVLGVITLGIILYGGFVYMTAGGNEDKVATARKILVNAVIGLVIIMSAWGITTFVLSRLSEATGSGTVDLAGGGGPQPGSACDPTSPNYNPSQCSNFCSLNPTYSACADAAFYVKSITPSTPDSADKTGMNNPRVRVLFSHSLASNTNLGQAVRLNRKGGAQVDTTVQLLENNRVIELTVAGNGKLEPGDYTVTVSGEVKDSNNGALEANYKAGNISYPLTADFSVDRVFDDTAIPRLENVTLNGVGGNDLPVYIGQAAIFRAVVRDRGQNPPFGGTGLVKIAIAEVGSNQVIAESYQAPAQRVGSSLDYTASYKTALDATKFSALKQYKATFTATDIATNQVSASLTFKVYAASCNNGIQDGDETAVDAGGSCGGAPGSSCTSDNQCAPGNKCLENKCTAAPQIRAVDPMDGAAGSWVTISGVGFGTTPGKIEFSVNNTWKEANIVACTGGVLSWNPTWVVAKVPEGLGATSAIRLTTGAALKFLADRTDDDYGPKPAGDGLFHLNTVTRPALCGVSVTDNAQITIGNNTIQVIKGANKGPVTTPVTVAGTNLGSNGTIAFGPASALGTNWIDVSLNTKVPLNLQPGVVPVSVTVDGKTSNAVPFTVQSATDGQQNPVISAIDPGAVTPRSYITIKGSGFSTLGTVYIASSAEKVQTCVTQNADTSCRSLNVSSFPVACGTTWGSTQVIAEVPQGTPVGEYFVLLRNGDQQRTDGQARLQVVDGAPMPSICALTPDQGPAPLNKKSSGLRLVGANFSDAPEVYFWQKDANANDLNTWLHSDANKFGDISVIKSKSDNEIITLIPVTASGQTMITGPIKVRAKTGVFGNSVKYTVNDCRQSEPISGDFQCCTTGPEAGVFKPSNLQCAGETREAGYVWRFTTGLIPELPRVAEQCNEVDWNKPGASIDFPSPTPWEKTNRGRSACLNASVAVRFTAPMDATTLNATNVKVFRCAQSSNGNIDCGTATEDKNLTLGVQNGSNAVLIIRNSANGNLEPNTWYRVQLSDKIQSLQYKQVLGQNQVQHFPLQKTRPCGAGTAYCYDFKTSDNLCQLSGVGVNPPANTVNYLGMLQDPSYPFEIGNPMAPSHPWYYYLWGKADQECSVLSADGFGWKWSAQPEVKAGATVAPGIEYGLSYTDSRAKVIAKEQTTPDKAVISASAPAHKVSNSFNWIDVLSEVGVKSDYSTAGAAATFPTNKVPLLDFDKPFTLDLQFKVTDKTLGQASTPVKTLFGKSNSYSFRYFAGTGANSFGLCIGTLVSGNVFGQSVCSHVAPTVDLTQRLILTWDGTNLTWYDNKASVVASGKIVFNKSLDFVKIGGTTPLDLTHTWDKLAIRAGAMTAEEVQMTLGLSGDSGTLYNAASNLYIDLLDPAVVEAGPSCAESCVNTDLWATFNRQMAVDTFANAGAWVVKECKAGISGACDESATTDVSDWFQVDKDLSNPTRLELVLSQGHLLKPNTYYKVTIGSGIKALDALEPPKLGKSLAEYTWTFRTQNNPTPCAPGSVRVTPQPFTATAVGQRTIYTAQPFSSPNACSQSGQPLSKWAYGYDWKTVDTKVATVSNITTGYGIKPYCSLTCLPVGAKSTQKDLPLCGNGKLDVGEDCDIADPASKGKCTLGCIYTTAERKALGQTGSLPLAAFDSSKPGQSYCGDGQVTKGETCDIKNDQGCTEQCLRRGSSLAATWCAAHANDTAETKASCINSVSICGNSVIEDGEMCEPGLNGADEKTCNSKTCLWQNTCGTAVQQCDPKTQEGCTSACVLAGSSPAYKNKSLCGDGQVGSGEFAACENTKNDGTLHAGPTQIVEAVGQGTNVSSTKFQETQVLASLLVTTTVKGTADYRLQCGYQEFLAPVAGLFNDCPQNGATNSNDYGVNSTSCCAIRVKRAAEYPVDGTGLGNSEPACRNTYIEAVYPRRLREDSLKDNIVLVRGYTNATTVCPEGALNVTNEMQRFVATSAGDTGPVGFWEGLWKGIKSFFRNLFGRDEAVATNYTNTINSFSLWCTAGVSLNSAASYSESGQSTTTTVALTINKALEGNTTYGVWVRGGKNGVADSNGVSVGSPDKHPGTPDDIWFFRTGADLCRLSEVGVTPSAYTFTKPKTSVNFVAFGKTPSKQQIVPTAAYDWVWSWKPIGTPIFDIQDVTTQTNVISSKDVQGQVTGVVQAKIIHDFSDTNNQQGQILAAPFELTAFFCEKPWPASGSYPFQDLDFNFSMSYCADAGKTGVTSDDLPYLNTPNVYTNNSQPPVPNDTLKKYLFFNDQNDDVIGIQIFRNDPDTNGAVKSLTQWYQDKFQSLGSMKPVTVSGYEALSDGSNYYVSALNYTGTNVYQNIYLFSINTNPQVATRAVFDKLLASLHYNTNLTDYGYCLGDKAGVNIRSIDVDKITDIACTSDLQCLTATGQALSGTNGVCSNAKTKFFRDWQRLHDVQLAQNSLDAYFNTVDKLLNFKADLKSGTFIPGYTSSRWPSWGTLGGLVGGLPVDPINNWIGCDSADGQTCWNATTNEFSCPKVSRVYEYEFTSSTGGYVFHAPLEFFTSSDTVTNQFIDSGTFSAAPWQQCVGNSKVSPFSAKCGDGAVGLGEDCDPPGTSVVTANGCSNNQTKTRTCNVSCKWENSACAAVGQCGNGKVEGDEICDEGSVNGQSGHCNATCSGYSAVACGNGNLDKPAEFCEKVNDITISISWGTGKKVRFKYGSDPRPSQLPFMWNRNDVKTIVSAGKHCSQDTSLLCKDDADCLAPTYAQMWDGNTSLAPGNVDGIPGSNLINTTNLTQLGKCSDIGNFGSTYNVKESLSCSYDCKKTGGYCGDKLVQTDNGEECDDGNTNDGDECSAFCQIEYGLICKKSNPNLIASKSSANKDLTGIEIISGGVANTQCVKPGTPSEICSAYELINGCSNIIVKKNDGVTDYLDCANGYNTKPVSQIVKEYQGVGIKDLTINCIGSVSTSTVVANNGGSCGNNKKDAGEACDLGDKNGKPCTPGYGASCQYCSNDCKNILTVDTPNFCGNGKIDAGSPEVCETINNTAYVTTTSGIVAKNCAIDQRGTYQCSNDCRILNNSCVTCGKEKGKPIPRLSLVNPLIGPGMDWPFTKQTYDGRSFMVSMYKTAPGNTFDFLGYSKISDWTRQPTTGDNYTEVKQSPSLYKNLWVDEKERPLAVYGLETNPMCSADYKLFFNYLRIVSNDNPSNIYGPWNPDRDGGLKTDYANFPQLGDWFDFPVGGQIGQVDQQLVYSPAVPPNTYRVVIRWTEAEQKAGLSFAGGVYDANTAKNNFYLDSYNENGANEWCNTMQEKLFNGVKYWWPTGFGASTCKLNSGVYMHQATGIDKTFVQALTINTTQLGSSNSHKTVAFYVKGLQQTIANSAARNITVEVYNYRNGQSSLYSVYKPQIVYSIKAAGGSSTNPLAMYWHVFNFVYQGGQYKIVPVGDGNGSIETDLCQVKANMPGVAQCQL